MIEEYNLMIEKCKRQDTTQTMIKCLDKAQEDYHQKRIDDFVGALEQVGIFVGCAILGVIVIVRLFK